MSLHFVRRTLELKGELEICKRVLAIAQDVDPAAGDDVEIATEELKSCMREKVDEQRHAVLDTEIFDKLDLSTIKGRWILCMTMLGSVRSADGSACSEILHEMYKPFIAYNVLVLQKYDSNTMTMTGLLRALKGKLRVESDLRGFMDAMLASLCEQWPDSNPEFLKQKMDEYVAEVVILTVERIDVMLEELAPLIELGEMLQGLYDAGISETAGLAADELVNGIVRNADELEEAGAPALIVLAARQMEAEAAAAAPESPESPDELEARGRIHEAVLRVMQSRDQMGVEHPKLSEVTQAWAMHPERLTVATPEGNVPLIEGVMGDPLVVEQIISAICRGKVIYAERVAASN